MNLLTCAGRNLLGQAEALRESRYDMCCEPKTWELMDAMEEEKAAKEAMESLDIHELETRRTIFLSRQGPCCLDSLKSHF